MKTYVQVSSVGNRNWHQVNAWYNPAHAVADAIHTYLNPNNPRSLDVISVRVVSGKRAPEILFAASRLRSAVGVAS